MIVVTVFSKHASSLSGYDARFINYVATIILSAVVVSSVVRNSCVFLLISVLDRVTRLYNGSQPYMCINFLYIF